MDNRLDEIRTALVASEVGASDVEWLIAEVDRLSVELRGVRITLRGLVERLNAAITSDAQGGPVEPGSDREREEVG